MAAGYNHFGLGTADVVTDDAGNVTATTTAGDPITATVWDADAGGVKVTDLLDDTGAVLPGVVTAEQSPGTDLARVSFQAPDAYTVLYLDFGQGRRWAVTAREALAQLGAAIAKADQASADAATASADASAAQTDAAGAVTAANNAVATANAAQATANDALTVNTDAYAKKTEVPSLDEQFVSVQIFDYAITTSTGREIPLLVAPFPLTVLSVDLVMGSVVPSSTVDYWTVSIERAGVTGAETPIASKSTIDHPMGNDSHWPMDVLFDPAARLLGVGESLHIEFTPTGAPPALSGPVLASVRYARSAP